MNQRGGAEVGEIELSRVALAGAEHPVIVVGDGFMRRRYLPEAPYVDMRHQELGARAVQQLMEMVEDRARTLRATVQPTLVLRPAP